MRGLVNAHTHLELTALGGTLPENVPFLEWITALVAMRRGFSDAEIMRGIERGIQTLVDTGTIAVGDITASGVSVEPLLH
ncbi:MAG: amidohydrolase family protein, partial [Chloroflexota bacterium]|nr:amidohydrolase family protein [Chloroflexota bacterium]